MDGLGRAKQEKLSPRSGRETGLGHVGIRAPEKQAPRAMQEQLPGRDLIFN